MVLNCRIFAQKAVILVHRLKIILVGTLVISDFGLTFVRIHSELSRTLQFSSIIFGYFSLILVYILVFDQFCAVFHVACLDPHLVGEDLII